MKGRKEGRKGGRNTSSFLLNSLVKLSVFSEPSPIYSNKDKEENKQQNKTNPYPTKKN